ncbi:MAG: GNAT family N-acetyltransferase [Bdellovibrionales bacterium]
MEFQIDLAKISDSAELNRLVNSAYRGDSSRKGWTTEADLLDGIRIDEERLKELAQKTNSYLLLLRNSQHEIVACVHLEEKGSSLYLGMLTVDPKIQNQGLGKILLKAAEEKAREFKLKSVFMTVISERKELIDWYVRHGYHKTGKTEPFPTNDPRFGLPKKPLEFLVLEKLLT